VNRNNGRLRKQIVFTLLTALWLLASLYLLPAFAATPGSSAAAPRMRRTTNAQRQAAAHRAAQRAQKARLASGAKTLATSANVPVPGGTPNYFGPEANWSYSPQPRGSVTGFTIQDGGSGYTAPVVTISDAFNQGTGASATATFNPNTGAITGIVLSSGGTGYAAPVVAITDPTGSGAVVTASIAGSTLTGGIHKFVDSLPQLGSAGQNNLGQYLSVAAPDTVTYPGSDYYEIELQQFTEKLHTDLLPTTLRGYVQTNNGTDPNTGLNTIAPAPIHYLGPLIVAQKNRPVRIKFTNKLATGAGGDLFLPVDTTEMGAGMGPLGMAAMPMNYTQNRGTLHLHGGRTPWISDGTPHQWITPAGENTSYPKGVSVQNVPDMPDPGDGSMTFFYSNQQSARLMFYHDHAYGITRLNVYAGEAAGYLLTDSTEQDLIARGILPADEIPLIIQDKTFVDNSTVLTTDPTWPFPLDPNMSNLWYPHVYMPNQNPNDVEGINAFGRWDYGPWFWPPWPVTNQPITLPDGTIVPNVPDLSMTMEAFHDTPLVNGTPYPYMEVQPKAYRFRILNAANDRMWNLQLYVADPNAPTEVRMVMACEPAANFPLAWRAKTIGQPGDILDGRTGGVPDPALIGPTMIQIGTEGGFLPAPVVWPNIPIGIDRDPKSITIGNVKEHNLFIGPAERADVIIDFSAFAGQTIILYNDSLAAVPANDSRLDYYTDNVAQTDTGGAPTTLPGYGPNTRTIMQFRVASTAPAPAFSLANLQNEFKSTVTTQGVFARSQDPIIVPQAGYDSAYNANFPSDKTAYVRISDNSLTFTPLGSASPVTINFKPKAIQELFENSFGRMVAFLGVELPFTNGNNQTTIQYGYIDPPTEIIDDTADPNMTQIGTLGDGTQIWKITHNGVDTHPIHFHLFDVQLLNRVDWAGVVKPPEPNELGWKETVRMNPLEDCIVALRPSSPKVPFGVPDSYRPLDPTMPIGDPSTFRNVGPDGNPVTVLNQVINFGWEYVWHCHILSHEEMDMMRPMIFNVARTAPAASVLGIAPAAVAPASLAAAPALGVNLTWTDPTPWNGVAPLSTLGDLSNEIGYWIERADVDPNGSVGTYATIAMALANHTSYSDTTVVNGHHYSYRVSAYNEGGDTPSNAVNINVGAVDGVPPVTTALLSGTAGANGWYLSTVTVTLSATDNMSGVAATYYTIDGGATQTYTAPFIVSGNAAHSISFWSVDVAGNTETANVQAVNIDNVAPTLVWGTLTPAANGFGWYNAAVNYPWTASDATSGVATPGPNGSAVISTQGTGQTGLVTITDVAGNSATFTSPAVNIDLTAPTLTATSSPTASRSTNRYTTITVSGRVTDALSGVNLTGGTYNVVDSQGTTIPGATFTVRSTGAYSFGVRLLARTARGTTRTYTITINVLDKAGNLQTAIRTFVVRG
jgi:FtsP/CotA-like multicopper oxidase with cupredoxin domain